MDSDFIKAILVWYLLNTLIDSLIDEYKQDIRDMLDKMRKD